MKTRVETIVTIDLAWRKDGKEIDVILPADTTDYIVTDHDGSESLYIVQNGIILIYDIDEHEFVKAGIISTNKHNELMKQCVGRPI